MKSLKYYLVTFLFLASSLSQAALITSSQDLVFDIDGDAVGTFPAKGEINKTFNFQITEKTLVSSWWTVHQTNAGTAEGAETLGLGYLIATLSSASNPAFSVLLGDINDGLGNHSKNYSSEITALDLAADHYSISFRGLATAGYKGTGTLTVNAAPVPEPETYALLGLGLIVILSRRNKVA